MKYHFWLSVGATAIFSWLLWMDYRIGVILSADAAGYAMIYAHAAYRLIFALILYITAMALIWSHGLFWVRANTPSPGSNSTMKSLLLGEANAADE